MSATRNNGLHLTVEIVREIHAEAIARFGGLDGVRETALLESAVAAPQASFGGQSPYKNLAEVAAAYLFYLCRNHPFVDGNKRTALGACIVFLRLNGLVPRPDGPEWEGLALAVAASAIDRDEATQRLRRLLPKSRVREEQGQWFTKDEKLQAPPQAFLRAVG
jgi:death-on-curing protein